jgi:hypothetical protein
MEMNALDLNLCVSGRFSNEEGMVRAKLSGDTMVIFYRIGVSAR